jgi:hypothetical protein
MNTVPTGTAKLTAQSEAIKKVVTRKLYKHQKPEKSMHDHLNPDLLIVVLDAMHGVWMIFPAIIVGIMSGIGAAFEFGIKKALETYRGN